MPKRIKGPLEQQLLEVARRRVRRERGAAHGEQVALANAIRRTEEWVSGYLDGTRYPNLDTYIAIADFCGFTLPELKGDVPLEPKLSTDARQIASWWDQVELRRRPALRTLIRDARDPKLVGDQQQTSRQVAGHRRTERRSRGRKQGA